MGDANLAYGPIVAGKSGIWWFTLRNRWDPGVRYMPAEREVLNAARDREMPKQRGSHWTRRWSKADSNSGSHPRAPPPAATRFVADSALGRDLTGRPTDTWIVDFNEMPEAAAALYEAPFEYVRTTVKPLRDTNNRERRRRFWWHHGETVPGLRAKIAGLTRLIGTPRVAKHRFFVWINPQVLPDSRVNVIARDDDATFGILHSRFHEAWSLRLGG